MRVAGEDGAAGFAYGTGDQNVSQVDLLPFPREFAVDERGLPGVGVGEG